MMDAPNVGDFVSFPDPIAGYRRYGTVLQVMTDYTMRINVSGRVFRVADRDITVEVG